MFFLSPLKPEASTYVENKIDPIIRSRKCSCVMTPKQVWT